MGIDIYARWLGITKEEEKQQYTGFSIQHGHVGYLREAYHGGPYATQVLVPEAFDAPKAEAAIPAATLRARLPKVLETVRERSKIVYNEEPTPEQLQSFTDFVELCERKEAETGTPVTIIASY